MATNLTGIKTALNSLRRKKAFVIILALLVLGALLYLSRSFFLAATVNGQPITRFALTKELEKRAGNETLQNLIEKALILQEAKRQKITISKDEIDNQVKSIEDTLKGQNMTLKDALTARGLSMNDLLDQIKLQKTVEALLAKNIQVSDSEIEAYFNQNKDSFGKNAKLADVKEEIRQQLIQQKLNQEYSKWISDLKAKAKINYFVHF